MLNGTVLLVLLVLSIVLLVLLIARWKVHAFLALLLMALGLGLAAGMAPLKVLDTILTGFGNSTKAIGIVILLGTIIGTVLDKSGAALTMADAVLKKVGPKRPALAMNIIGAVVSIPVFCDSGFVILSSINKTLARRSGVSMVTMAVALAAGLYATHTLVPPTPGPIAAAANLNADLGLLILFGILVAIPVALVGLLWGLLAKYVAHSTLDDTAENGEEWLNIDRTALPDVKKAFTPIGVPLVLIAVRSLVNFPVILDLLGGKEGIIPQFFNFIGDPVIALLFGLLLCVRLVPTLTEEVTMNWVGQGIKDAAPIIMITAAGGSFGAIIAGTNIGTFLGETLAQYNLGLFLPFILAAALKTAQGSSTVALITASTIVYPLLATLGFDSPTGAVLVTLAVGCGSMVISHANDSYFWVVSQFSGFDLKNAYKAHSMASLVMGFTGLGCVWLLSQLFI